MQKMHFPSIRCITAWSIFSMVRPRWLINRLPMSMASFVFGCCDNHIGRKCERARERLPYEQLVESSVFFLSISLWLSFESSSCSEQARRRMSTTRDAYKVPFVCCYRRATIAKSFPLYCAQQPCGKLEQKGSVPGTAVRSPANGMDWDATRRSRTTTRI